MMNDKANRSLAIHLEQVNAPAENATDHSRYQEPYTRPAYRLDNTSFSVRATRYQEAAPFMLPEASTMLPIYEEEDEEVILDDDDNDDGHNEIGDGGVNDLVDLANRAFIATCQKFARQNYPEFRRRAPYSFLENWHLHSMYSKSQQILLGILHAQPVVLLSGDDFMFTPQLVQQQHYDHMEQMEFDWNEVDSAMDDDDNDNDDDGLMLVTARAPEDFMDENAWLSNHHSPPFEDQLQEIPQPHNDHQQQQLSQQDNDHDDNHDNEDEEGPIDHQEGFTLSPEIVHWYRSAQYQPLTSTEQGEEEQHPQQEQEEKNNKGAVSRVDSYHSLVDMLPLAPVAAQDVVIAIPVHEGYGSVRQMQAHQQHTSQTNTPEDNGICYYFYLIHASKRLTDTAEMVADLIDNFDRTKTSVSRFMLLLFYIWRLLFLSVEYMLADIGAIVLPSRRHQQLSSRKASLTH